MTISLFIAALSAITLRLVMDKLPRCTVHDGRWSCKQVCTCAGLVFLPFYLPMLPFSEGTGSLVALGLASVVVWAMGALDDFNGVNHLRKLQCQILVALFLVACGWNLNWTSYLVPDFILSMIWIVGLTNAFNLIDNMDGLATGTVAIIALFLVLSTGNPLATVLLGLSIGFLIFNFPPAKLYMGDCGAYFFGLNLACLTMDAKIGGMAVLLLLVPIADTTFVTIRRLSQGKSPMTGGTDHLSHELARRFKELPAVLILWAVSVVGGILFLVL
jgi:UDP-GlcNAc:undecaprenyl-phosphate GlcNAc-1-phosphate transferase